jgi:hypothetical protein
MLKRIIIFLIRMRLGLKKYECFRFSNQKSGFDKYYFDETSCMKIVPIDGVERPSNVSLNWLLSDECKIEKLMD